MKKGLWFLSVLVLCWNSIMAQERFWVVIDEVMADPTPQVALPINEWLELRNTTSSPINLQGWRITDATGQSGPIPNFILQPDSCVTICSSGALIAMSAFGPALAVTGFPSLDNDGDILSLKSSNGKIIHAISYNTSWYHNETKKEGGWSIEMIDTRNPCGGINNWKASQHNNGGTPGKKNSVDGNNSDQQSPRLTRAYAMDSTTAVLVFDEPIDSLSGATAGNYSIDGNLAIDFASSIPPLFNQVKIKMTVPMVTGTIYHITANLIKDCSGNQMQGTGSARLGLASDAGAGEWIVNEILFNPRPSGFDFIECFNNCNRILDASKLYIANRNNSGALSSIKVLSPEPFLVFPGDHIVVTENAENLAIQYLVKNPENVLQVPTLPSFPDDEGDVVLLNFSGAVADEVKYKDDWHFKLITDGEAVALERIDPGGASNDPANWHSAASTSGYGTPTYKNSQYRLRESISARVVISPNVFSPDNDGLDDVALIQYEFAAPGFVANIFILDAAGRMVRQLVHNGLAGLKGSWNWDGLGENGQRLPLSYYVIITEIFNLQGKRKSLRIQLSWRGN